jgi:hypothetical protein
MIKRRLTRALPSIGLAGGLLLGTAGAAGANAPFPQIGPVRENARTDIVLGL